MKSFFRFFVKRQKLATLLTLMTIMLGVSTLISIKRDIYPYVDFGVMTVITRYPGASPEDVELNVTNRIEDELKSVTGLDKVTSVSMENVSVITVMLDVDVSDPESVKTEVREAVGRVSDFPPEVTDSPLISDLSSSDMDVIEVGLSGDVPYGRLREYARILEKKLKNIPGVSRLDKFGYRSREVRIEVSPAAATNYQAPLREMIRAIQSRNIRGTGGSFESYTSEKNLVTLAQFEDPLEVGDVIVRSTFDGPALRVSDLAQVKDDFEDERVMSRLNGRAAISFLVFISKSADVIRTCDNIKALVAAQQETLPDDIDILHINDASRLVSDSFDVVLTNGWIGLLLVLVVLAVFLNFRTALWVALGIPTALLGTVFLLPVFGVFLDTVTLTGMILVIGIIVDDAIIIAENIARRRELGDSPIEAGVNGLQEVYKPVVTTILTTFLVFAPMFFMPGLFGKYLVTIPLAISLALFISLIEATVALPAHLIGGLRRINTTSARHRWFDSLRDRYRRLVASFLRFRYVVATMFVLVLVGTMWYAGNYIKFVLFPSDQADTFFVFVELPKGTSLEATSNKVMEIEDIIAALPENELASFNARIGTNYSQDFVMAESENFAALRIRLSPYSERDRTAAQIAEALREETDLIEGVVEIKYGIESGGPPVGKPVNLRIVGAEDDLRERLADSVQALLATIDGVHDIGRDDKPGKDQVEINIDYDKLSRLGLTVADVAQNVRIAYDGEVITSVRYGDEDVDFRILMDKASRQQLNMLSDLPIPNNRNRLIPLREVATLSSGPGPSDYHHYDGERTVTVVADVKTETITPLEVTETVLGHFDLDRDWPGMQLDLGGEAFETEESMAGLMRTFVIALIAVYFLLIILFNSYSQPLVVMAAIPFGLIGVIAAFGFHGQPLSFTAIMGIIGLAGVVVNDSLVLVSHVNDLKQKHPERKLTELVAEGTADRLRAIILTTLTTVAALLPLAYGIGGSAVFMAPMALALGWGLFFATPLTLVLVPSLYLISADIGRLFGRKATAQ